MEYQLEPDFNEEENSSKKSKVTPHVKRKNKKRSDLLVKKLINKRPVGRPPKSEKSLKQAKYDLLKGLGHISTKFTNVDIANVYNSVKAFNAIAGNLKDVDLESIKNQIKFIQSELDETQEAFDTNNEVEVIDGACDVLVTALGLIQKLEAAGYHMRKAMYEVCANNLTKYPSKADLCVSTQEAHPEWTLERCAPYRCYVFKDENGKVRKPVDYVSVDLQSVVDAGKFSLWGNKNNKEAGE